MKPFQISSSNLMELTDMPAYNGAEQFASTRLSKYQSSIGRFEASSYLLPNMTVMNLDWNIKNDLLIVEDETDTDMVSVNFQLQGNFLSDFRNVRALEIQPRTHNLLFSTPADHMHHIPGGQDLKMMHIAIDRQYFAQLIGADDHWSEKALRNMETGNSFLGGNIEASISPAMLYLIQSIQNNPGEGSIRNLQVQAKVFELLAMQLEQFRKTDCMVPGLNSDDTNKLHELHLYIQHHFLEDLSLFQLARIFTMNEFKLKKGFKALFNTTIFGYIRDLRMQHATVLLKDEKKPVEEVAYELGFEHAQHFSTSFKKHFGVSPSAWR
jgi:AraC-like DNA-binding protein